MYICLQEKLGNVKKNERKERESLLRMASQVDYCLWWHGQVDYDKKGEKKDREAVARLMRRERKKEE